jgi:hypothetical protein
MKNDARFYCDFHGRHWNRGREYEMSLAAKKIGPCQLTDSTYAPTMAATILVQPGK